MIPFQTLFDILFSMMGAIIIMLILIMICLAKHLKHHEALIGKIPLLALLRRNSHPVKALKKSKLYGRSSDCMIIDEYHDMSDKPR